MKYISFFITFLSFITIANTQKITYCIENESITGTTTLYHEFDVYVEADMLGHNLSDGVFYMNYNPEYFGASVVTNGRLFIDRDNDVALLDMKVAGLIYIYTPILTGDNATNRFGVVWELGDATKTFAQTIPIVSTYLCHVRIEVSNISQNPDLQFDLPLMDRETFYYDGNLDASFPMDVDTCIQTFLPIELDYFEAARQERTVLLEWGTMTETHNSHFEIQRSIDGYSWDNIGRVAAKGDSFPPVDYHFTDNNPLLGNNYYRLKQIDIDGDFDYSAIKVVEIENLVEDGILVYPNPFKAFFYIEFPFGEYEVMQVELVDVNGKKIFSQTMDSNQNRKQINMEYFESGVYFIHFVMPEERIVKKVFKQ